MPKFKISDKYALSSGTVAYRIPYIDEKIFLYLMPATQANKAFFNAQILTFKQDGSRKKVVNSGVLDETRDSDRRIYAKHVVKGWDGVEDENGIALFTPEACLDFLNQLPDWLFDELRTFATEPSNFLATPIDTEGLGKNS